MKGDIQCLEGVRGGWDSTGEKGKEVVLVDGWRGEVVVKLPPNIVITKADIECNQPVNG